MFEYDPNISEERLKRRKRLRNGLIITDIIALCILISGLIYAFS